DVRITNIYEGTTQLQVVAAIGGIVSGMSSKGHLRQYFEEEFSKIGGGSTLLNENKDSLEKIVESYSSIENSSLRDEVAFEVVQSTARVLIGLLLEKGVSKLNNETKKKREILSRDYNLESKAILLSNRIIIEDRQTQLTFV
ncbi:acyl-CoA dehydrogenase family protein, partial [Leptospira kirschneri]